MTDDALEADLRRVAALADPPPRQRLDFGYHAERRRCCDHHSRFCEPPASCCDGCPTVVPR